MVFKRSLAIVVLPLFLCFCGKDDQGGLSITEDFSSLSYFDPQNSTGVWNTADRAARAGVSADGDSTRSITFGDGSDGEVVTSNGFTFDTTKPGGYQFTKLVITGGSVVVQGNQPLIIKSLGEVQITPTIDISGEHGADGVVVADPTTSLGGNGGSGKAGGGQGGNGGAAVPGPPLSDLKGLDGIKYDGNADAIGGNGENSSSVANASVPNIGNARPSGNFDQTIVDGGFIGASGGGGGGGHYTSGDANHATGGAGGGGGGAIKISAVGPVSLGTVLARGGNGGTGAATTAACSGDGGGGGGGAVWLQSATSVSTASDPDIAEGLGGVGATGLATPCGAPPDGWQGRRRADAPPSLRPTWGAPATFYDTTLAVAGTYTIQSKAYDLQTFNVKFADAPTVESEANGGTVRVEYAGSKDGTDFGDWSEDIQDLNNKSYRYVRFKITLVSGTTSPRVTLLRIPYEEAGVGQIDAKLSAGCGSLSEVRIKKQNSSVVLLDSSSDKQGALFCMIWLVFYGLTYLLFRLRLSKA